MAYIKNYCTKLVIFLFCLSQIQGESDIKSEEYIELFNVIQGSTSRISKMVQNRLMEAGVPVDQLKRAYHKIIDNPYISDKTKTIAINAYSLWALKFDLLDLENISQDEEIKEIFIQLNKDLKQLDEETIKVLTEHLLEVKEKVANRTKPIVKHLIPIVKDIEEIVFAIFPNNTKGIEKN